jgi:hypothetical protein
LKGFLEEGLPREEAADRIAEKYLRFVKVYQEAEQAAVA